MTRTGASPTLPALRGRSVLVCGIGVTGIAVARTLIRAGAIVRVVAESRGPDAQVRAEVLESLGAVVELHPVSSGQHLGVPDLVVTSPGLPPDHPLLQAAAARSLPVWGDVELAWQINPPETRWLAITGTNGKTTTTEMLAAMITAAGIPGAAAGNIGVPLVEAVQRRDPVPELLAVELSSAQLHWTHSVRPIAGAVLNLADDHLDWHGSVASYAAAKAKIWATGTTAVFNADDPRVVSLLGGRPGVGFTLNEPQHGELGVDAGLLVDRAFGCGTLLAVDEMQVRGGHNVANALAASALALAGGVPAGAVRATLRAFSTGAHRNVVVAEIDGVRYVDDSKATNPHAAAASLASYDRVVWIAGGLNKGLTFDDLVRETRGRMIAAVLIGRCAGEIREALARHAPDVPVQDAADLQTAVQTARGLAHAGDVVLLAPAAASMDMFRDYAHRGDVFAAAARAQGEQQ